MDKRRITVLLAEESKNDAEILSAYLENHGFGVVRASDFEDLMVSVSRHRIDAVVLSFTLPRGKGLHGISQINHLDYSIPVIVIMSPDDRAFAEEMILGGAQECLFKDEINGDSLVRALNFGIQRKLRESSLAASEDHYRDLVEQSRDLICTHDLEGNILSVNVWPARLLGYEPEALEKMNIRDILVPEFAEQFEKYLETIKETGSARGFMAVQTFSGERRIWEYSNTLRTTGVSSPVVRGMAHDVTDYKKSVRRLKKQKDLLEEQARLLNLAHDAFILYDMEGGIRFWNRGAEELYGWLQEETLGKNINQLLQTEFSAEMSIILESFLKRGEWVGELHQKRKDGKEIIVSSRWVIYEQRDASVPRILEINRDITEKKRSDEAIRLGEERLRLVCHATNDVIWDWNIITNEIWWSSNLKDVFGYSTSELDFDSWSKKLHPDDRDRVLNGMKSDIQNGISFAATEYRFCRADGEYVYVLDRSCLEFGPNKEPIRMIGTAMDISEQKRNKYKLEESLSLLQATLESTADGILVVNNSGKIVRFNNKFVQLWRLPDHILALRDDNSALAFVLEQLKYPEAFLAKVKELYSDPLVESFDVLEFNDGRVFERYSKSQTIGGEAVGRVWSFRDVTERYRTEQELRESEARFRSLFEESKDVVFVSTPQGKLIDINPAGVQLLGYASKQEILRADMACDLFWNPADRKKYRDLLDSQGFVKDYELVLKKKNGEKLFVLETSTVVKDAEGNTVAIRGIFRDITELKELQENLIQSKKMETIGRLAGGVAHDFNNLLMAISGYSDLVNMQLHPKDPMRENISQIQRAVEQGAALTRQLLAFSRKQMLQPTSLDLNGTLRNLDDMLRRLIGEDIELIMVCDSELFRISADPVQIEQVILNLALNARDAMPGGGKLIIETSNRELGPDFTRRHSEIVPGRYIMMAVSDTGMGMDSETASRVFEPFFTTKGTGKGTGLGLATTYGIIRQSGGHILLYTEPGQGSVFKVFFPAVETGDIRLSQPDIPPTAAPCDAVTILLVDDNEHVRKSVGDFLRNRGYDVIEAGSGQEALEISRTYPQQIHLLLTDIVMPKMNGPELAKLLTEHHEETKVLFMSGYAEEAVLHQSRMESDAAFIAKPVSMKALLSKIHEIIPST